MVNNLLLSLLLIGINWNKAQKIKLFFREVNNNGQVAILELLMSASMAFRTLRLMHNEGVLVFNFLVYHRTIVWIFEIFIKINQLKTYRLLDWW